MSLSRAIPLIAVLALFAGACGSADPPGEEPGEVGEASPSASEAAPAASEATTASEQVEATPEASAPDEGGTLVVAISQDPGMLNPAITTSGAVHTASEIMYNGLVRLDESSTPQPDLAESWDITDDGATYTFTLREDVVWHDGEPFTSEDVKFTFEEALLEFHSRTSASMGDVLDSIDTPDDRTVVFSFSQPYAPLLQQLDVSEAPILPEHVYADVPDIQEAEANLEPVGTGPFRFVSYSPDAEVVVERNPDYFLDGLPELDQIVMRVIPEASNQVIALEAGEVDWLWGAPGPDLQRLEDSGDYGFLQTASNPGGSNCIMTVSFNLDRPILQDPAVRRAFSEALDPQVYLDNILFGSGQVAQAPISSGIPFAHATDLPDMPTFDPTAAQQRLEEAGWVAADDGSRTALGVEGVDDGTPLSLSFLSFPTFSAYGDVMREQLGAVGIDLNVESLEPSAFADRVFVERDFDTNIISYCNGPDPEIGVRRMYISSNIQPIPFSNSSAYANPEVDELFDQARAEVDTSARSELYGQIQQILTEDLPYFWLVETEAIRVHTVECDGFEPYALFAEAASCSR